MGEEAGVTSAFLTLSTYGSPLAINPTNTSIIYAGTDSECIQKHRWGMWSCSASNSGLTNTKGVYALAIDPSDPITFMQGRIAVFLRPPMGEQTGAPSIAA